jgi:predicted phage terminase large subunit-like protein
MAELELSLHPNQLEVFSHPAKYKVVVAGRRWGKTRLAIAKCITEAMASKPPHDVYYIAPIFKQAKRIAWPLLDLLARPVISRKLETEAQAQLSNGVWIRIAGADDPDQLRGSGWAYAILDEYADMKSNVWEEIVLPALIDVDGGALFIGTPKPAGIHFRELYYEALKGGDWAAWKFPTVDNPFLKPEVVNRLGQKMSSTIRRQELEASFEDFTSDLFKAEWIKEADEPDNGEFVVAVDLAGFDVIGEAKKKRLDDTAIVCVKMHDKGWWVADIEYGRWDIRETALRILRVAHRNKARIVGIEIGALRNAVYPYLTEQMARINYFPRLETVTHGGKQKVDRVVWALQARMERGTVTFRTGAIWMHKLKQQLTDFPNESVHDDLVDALAYISQIAFTPLKADQMEDVGMGEDYQPFDIVSGY